MKQKLQILEGNVNYKTENKQLIRSAGNSTHTIPLSLPGSKGKRITNRVWQRPLCIFGLGALAIGSTISLLGRTFKFFADKIPAQKNSRHY